MLVCVFVLLTLLGAPALAERGLVEVRYEGKSTVCEFDPESGKIYGIGKALNIPSDDLSLRDLRKICKVREDRKELVLYVYGCRFGKGSELSSEPPEGPYADDTNFDFKGLTYSGNFQYLKDERTEFTFSRTTATVLAEMGLKRPLDAEGEVFLESEPSKISFSLLARKGRLSLKAGRIIDEDLFFQGLALKFSESKKNDTELKILSHAGCTADVFVNGLHYRTVKIDKDLYYLKVPVISTSNRYEVIFYCPEGISRKTYRYEKRDRTLSKGQKDLFLGMDTKEGAPYVRAGYGITPRFSFWYERRDETERSGLVASLGSRILELWYGKRDRSPFGNITLSGDTFLVRIEKGEDLLRYEVDKRLALGGKNIYLRATERETALGTTLSGKFRKRYAFLNLSLLLPPAVKTSSASYTEKGPRVRLFSRIRLSRNWDLSARLEQDRTASLELERIAKGWGRLSLGYERNLEQSADTWSLGLDLTEKKGFTFFVKGNYSPNRNYLLFAGIRGSFRRSRGTYFEKPFEGKGCLEIAADIPAFTVTVKSWTGRVLFCRTVKEKAFIPLKPDETYIVEMEEGLQEGKLYVPQQKTYTIHTFFHACNVLHPVFEPVKQVSGRSEKEWGEVLLHCTCSDGKTFKRKAPIFMHEWTIPVPEDCTCKVAE
ncbi:hypothetical protein [Thermodesulfatator autotrophicus]|nr:hypothetical protein [Thermodesulfatator autotrophicus]